MLCCGSGARGQPRIAADSDYLDPRQITLVVFLLDPSAGGKPMTLFFDNVRLAREATGKVEVRPR